MTLPPPGSRHVACPNCAQTGEHRVTQELLTTQLRQVQEAVSTELVLQHERALALLAERLMPAHEDSVMTLPAPSETGVVTVAAKLEETGVMTVPAPPPRPAFQPPPPKPLFEPVPVLSESSDVAHEVNRYSTDSVGSLHVMPFAPPLTVGVAVPPQLPGSPPIEEDEDIGSTGKILPVHPSMTQRNSARFPAPDQQAALCLSVPQQDDEPQGFNSHASNNGVSRMTSPSNRPRNSARTSARVSARVPSDRNSARRNFSSSGKCELLEVWYHGSHEFGDSSVELGHYLGRVTTKHGPFKTHKKRTTMLQPCSSDAKIDERADLATTVDETDDVSPEIDKMVGIGCFAKMVLHPYNSGRSLWDIGSLILVLWDMVFIPFGFFQPKETLGLVVMTWTTRIFWSMDMPMSFISGYVTNTGCIEMRPRKIIRKYLKGWFGLDALVVGVDWFEILMAAAAEGLGFARFGKVSRIFRILRMIRLLRLARMTEILNLLTERVDSEKLVILIDVVKLVIIMLAVGHLVACIWYAIGNADGGKKNWLHEYEYVDEELELRYVMSLRWAISQFAGGMDEVTPQSLGEHLYAVLVYMTAFWSGAVFVSILTSSMTQWYIIGSQQAQQLTNLRRYLSQNGISKKLALRVQRNAKHSLEEEQRHMPESAVALIKHVSEALRIELHFEMYSPKMQIHPFFARYVEECPHVVRKICHTAMQTAQASPGDTIFNNGEIPSRPKMFIVHEGHLDYIVVHGETFVVDPGQWVSEASLWAMWVHQGTLSASEDCHLYTLDAKEFQAIVGQFEHIGFDPRAYAKMFVDILNELDDLSDLPSDGMTERIQKTLNQEIHADRSAWNDGTHSESEGSDHGWFGFDIRKSLAAIKHSPQQHDDDDDHDHHGHREHYATHTESTLGSADLSSHPVVFSS